MYWPAVVAQPGAFGPAAQDQKFCAGPTPPLASLSMARAWPPKSFQIRLDCAGGGVKHDSQVRFERSHRLSQSTVVFDKCSPLMLSNHPATFGLVSQPVQLPRLPTLRHSGLCAAAASCIAWNGKNPRTRLPGIGATSIHPNPAWETCALGKYPSAPLLACKTTARLPPYSGLR